MNGKRRITFYTDLNGPHEDQVREQVAMTPEERWQVFLRMKRRHYSLFGPAKKIARRISIETPTWI
ncbi:hypothetical protein ACFSUS_26335 [Spirosoma soli]|uniref:Uncharacterized protein n=1 Tax=Spirosoma soli TaxID=1770529 RepID=A0ABW5MCF1_9BACT